VKSLLFWLLVAFPLFLFSQTTNIKENLGQTVNTAEDQILPVFSLDGQTLYFSENAANGRYEVWFSQRDRAGNWNPKQKAEDLNPPTNGSKYVFAQVEDDLLLVNGWFEQTENGWLQSTGLSWYVPSEKRFVSLKIPELQRKAKGRFVNAFLHRTTKTLLLSFAENEYKNLYVCQPTNPAATWTELNWQAPVKISSPLNSEYDDTTPFLDPDGETLYFASNRPGGYGETDIYSSQRLDNSWMRWSEPENLGFGVNSNFSEIYYGISPLRDFSYFVSYKYSYGSGDIFRLRRTSENRAPVTLLSLDRREIVWESPTINAQRLAIIIKSPTRLDVVPVTIPEVQTVEITQLSVDEYKPNNLVFLIDRSSSMQPSRRLPLLKYSLKQLISQLRDIDRLTLMSFADKAVMHYSTRGVTDKDSIYDVIDQFMASGDTKANQGLQLAYDYTKQNFINDGNNEIILATDGQFTLSPEDRKLIEANQRIVLSVIGMGDDPRALSNLRRLAARASGSFIHIESVETATEALLEEVKARSRI